MVTPTGVVTYGYDALGRTVSTAASEVASPDTFTKVTRYEYDALGRLQTVEEDLDPSSALDPRLSTEYAYELTGNLDLIEQSNGVLTDYEYDALNRLDTLTHYRPDNTPDDLSDNPKLAEFDYEVLANGSRSGMTEQFWLEDDAQAGDPADLTNTYSWRYDRLNRLNRLIDELFTTTADDANQPAPLPDSLQGILSQDLPDTSRPLRDFADHYSYENIFGGRVARFEVAEFEWRCCLAFKAQSPAHHSKGERDRAAARGAGNRREFQTACVGYDLTLPDPDFHQC